MGVSFRVEIWFVTKKSQELLHNSGNLCINSSWYNQFLYCVAHFSSLNIDGCLTLEGESWWKLGKINLPLTVLFLKTEVLQLLFLPFLYNLFSTSAFTTYFELTLSSYYFKHLLLHHFTFLCLFYYLLQDSITCWCEAHRKYICLNFV